MIVSIQMLNLRARKKMVSTFTSRFFITINGMRALQTSTVCHVCVGSRAACKRLALRFVAKEAS